MIYQFEMAHKLVNKICGSDSYEISDQGIPHDMGSEMDGKRNNSEACDVDYEGKGEKNT